jgi:peptidoglycan/LPS O-acetylase OafA/YrhL
MDPVFDTTMMKQDVAYPPRAWDVVTQSVRVMFTGVTHRTLNRSLWTMRHELVGSYVVFCFLILFGALRHRWFLYFAAGGATLLMGQPYVIDFLVGMALCDVSGRVPSESRTARRLRAWALPSLALGVGYMLFWGPFLDHGWRIYELFHVGPAIAAGLVVFGAVHATRIQAWLQLRPIVFFGRISFASYLLHLSVIYGVGGWIFKWCYDVSGSYATGFVAGYVVSLIALLGAATAFTRYVDQPAMALSRWVANTLAGENG